MNPMGSYFKVEGHSWLGTGMMIRADVVRNFRAAVFDENNRVCWGPLG
jgi:hypothetical protein